MKDPETFERCPGSGRLHPLAITLDLMVPMRIEELKYFSVEEVTRLTRAAGKPLAEAGDQLLFGGKLPGGFEPHRQRPGRPRPALPGRRPRLRPALAGHPPGHGRAGLRGGAMTMPRIGQDPRAFAIEQLAADLARVLRSLEWTGQFRGVPACPRCVGVDGDDGHLDICPLGLALRRADELGIR